MQYAHEFMLVHQIIEVSYQMYFSVGETGSESNRGTLQSAIQKCDRVDRAHAPGSLNITRDNLNPPSQPDDYFPTLPNLRLLGTQETDRMDMDSLRVVLEQRLQDCEALLRYQASIHKKLKDFMSHKSTIASGIGPELALEDLRKYVRELEEGLSALRVFSGDDQPKSTALSQGVDSILGVNVNGVTVNLHFKNSGNNDINDIETYLQEKLDVLEFIQMDCNKMEMSQLPSSGNSKLYRAPQIEKSSLSVSDWYGYGNKSIHISQSDSFVESVHAPSYRSHLKELANDGFFIGTPSGDSRSRVDASENPPRNDVSDESQLEWETNSILSNGRSMNVGRSTSRRRSISNSSVSSVESSRSRTKPSRGMFGRGRLERLAANMSGYSDESVVGGLDTHTQSIAASGWW
jgi:hypothetical protein